MSDGMRGYVKRSGGEWAMGIGDDDDDDEEEEEEGKEGIFWSDDDNDHLVWKLT